MHIFRILLFGIFDGEIQQGACLFVCSSFFKGCLNDTWGLPVVKKKMIDEKMTNNIGLWGFCIKYINTDVKSSTMYCMETFTSEKYIVHTMSI